MSTKNFFASFAMLDRQLLIRGKILSPVEFSGALSFCQRAGLRFQSLHPRTAKRHPTTPMDTNSQITFHPFHPAWPAKNSPFLHFAHSLQSHGLTLSES